MKTKIANLEMVRAFIADLPAGTLVEQTAMDDPEFVVIVDSRGAAQRIVAKTTRLFCFCVHVPVSS